MAISNGALRAIFYTISGVALLCFFYSVKFFLKRQVKTEKLPFGMPAVVCLLALLEYICIAILVGNDPSEMVFFRDTRIIAHSLTVPTFIVCLFELSYLIHKRRSVNFMGIRFDGGHRQNTNTRSVVVRYCVWVVAVGVMAFTLAVAGTILADEDEANRQAMNNERLQFEDGSLIAMAEVIPATILVVFAGYIGVMSWRYGTHYSFRVHATYCNPWVAVLFGAVLVLVGRLLSDDVALTASNVGEVCMLVCLMLVLPEMHNDLKGQADFAGFLSTGVSRQLRGGESAGGSAVVGPDTGAGEAPLPMPSPVGNTAPDAEAEEAQGEAVTEV